ncbi:MAG: hypothetical protein J5992_09845 [Oscillospiraceae bacterium]|nr:hypothetical protein [Oscillospiraceae bacterium]
MNIKITAEFDSVDSAEFAAISINKRRLNAGKILIDAPSPDKGINYVPYLYPASTEAPNVPNFLPAVFNDNTQFRLYNDNVSLGKPEVSKAAVIQVICNENDESEVRKIILNHKGLKIHSV